MSKIKLLFDVVEDMRSLADSLQAVATALGQSDSEDTPAPAPAPETPPAPAPADPLILIEQRLDFSCWVPDGFGTGDCLIVADRLLHIIDFKYGQGVLVDAEENPQMMLYTVALERALQSSTQHYYDVAMMYQQQSLFDYDEDEPEEDEGLDDEEEDEWEDVDDDEDESEGYDFHFHM